MFDRLLPFYARELDALRGLAGRFAEAYPKIAGRLRLTSDTVDDPHVERLLEGVAFLSARAQQRLDDEFPEITDALLGVLYPHYLAPVPSAAIVRFGCKPDARGPVAVPSGTMLVTDPIRGEPCRFQTCYDTTIWPIAVESTRLTGLPLAAPANPQARGARSCLRIVLRLLDPDTSFAELGISELRCFLRGSSEQSLPLYELLCGHTVGVAVANGPNDDRPTTLPPETVQPVGFAPEHALLSVVGALLLRLSPADRIFRAAGEIPVRRLQGAGRPNPGPRRRPAGNLRLSGPGRTGTGAPVAAGLPGAGLHPGGQSVPAPLRTHPPRPPANRISCHRRQPAPAFLRDMEHREGPRNARRRLDPALAPVLSPSRRCGGRWRACGCLYVDPAGQRRAGDRNGCLAGAVRSCLVGRPSRRVGPVGRCDVHQSRPAEPDPVRRRPPANSSSRRGSVR